MILYEILITSTALICGIFCLRKLSKGKISMRLRYALWLLVAVRLLVPASVGTSALSVMNLVPVVMRERAQTFFSEERNSWRMPADGGRDVASDGGTDGVFADGRHMGTELTDGQSGAENGVVMTAGNTASGENMPETAEGVGTDTARGNDSFAAAENSGLSLNGVLGMLWLLGFLAVGGYMVVSEYRFIRYLHKNRKAFPAEEIPAEFAGRFSRRGMKVYRVKGLPGPCLAGRHIYIGEGVAVQQNLSHILAHEYCHALHGDGLWAFLRCALAAVYWFDPLVWAAAYAARQDSELACDEAAVKLLGESSRFDYGRTLLALLESAGCRGKCPGMTFMTEGGGRSVRERITALTEKSRTRGAVLAAVFAAVVLVCGCAFTGAERDGADLSGETGEQETAGTDGNGQADRDAAAVSGAQHRQQVNEENNEEFARIQKEYEDIVKNEKLMEEQIGEQEKSALREADRAAFQDMMDYYSAMEESGNREFDIQSYHDWKRGKGGEEPEDGWYLLCREEGGLIYLYGLYTEEFGFRGLKLRIGQDETTLDISWCASLLNGISENIRILEYTENRAPRRFVWKLLAKESSTTEIWRLYSGYRHDNGMIDLKTLTEEDCLAWAKEHLSFDVDREAEAVDVTYDGDMYLGAIDISAYRDWETEDVQIVPDAVCFTLDDPEKETLHYHGDEGDYQVYSDTLYEGTAVYLTAGLKFAGVEGLWFDGLPLLTVQVVEDEESASGFRLERPRIDETYVANMPLQEKALSELESRSENADAVAGHLANDAAEAGRDDLEKPLTDGAQAHHDLEITFSNPCPDFYRISDGYGKRTHPVTGEVRTHTGVDMAAPEGADILAAADGMVCMTGFDTVNGNYVVLWHGQSGQMTYYTHCKTIEVEKGQQVAREEKIATVGKTGTATGPFLHFAVSSDTNWEEPHWEELDE